MDIDNQTALVRITETCATQVGCKLHGRCGREPLHEGVHAIVDGNMVLLYSREDPSRSVFDHCRTCFIHIADESRAEGVGNSYYCREHIGPYQERHNQHNVCKDCGYDGPHDLRNYSMMWHDGDIHCGRCGAYVRMFDAG